MPDHLTTLTIDKLQAWSDSLADVIETMDGRSTPQRLCAALGELVPIDFSGVFVLRRDSAPIGILDDIPADTVIHVPLSRIKGSPPFSQDDIDMLNAASPAVVATMRRFWEVHRTSFEGGASSADSFHMHLRHVMDNFGCSLLTAREMDIMQLTMRGYSDELSARQLDITPGTVRNHKKSIFSKLHVSSQGQVFGLLLDALQMPESDVLGKDPLAVLLESRS